MVFLLFTWAGLAHATNIGPFLAISVPGVIAALIMKFLPRGVTSRSLGRLLEDATDTLGIDVRWARLVLYSLLLLAVGSLLVALIAARN